MANRRRILLGGLLLAAMAMPDAADARVDPQSVRAPHVVVMHARPLFTPPMQADPLRRGQTILVPTAHGHEHMTLPPLSIAAPDRFDPWAGDAVDVKRFRAELDLDDPWTGEKMAVSARTHVADRTDPWE